MQRLSYRTRKRLSLLILVIGLPFYIILAVNIVDLFDRPSIIIEFLVYLILGVLWALPFRAIFRGIGVADPDSNVGSR
ncbi:MAG: DUF2842 domain-containing protein [Aestuariivita sp.]|nr:DUF2842 domain-containing protein [Aestuariivita sp.]MCY4202833.1 DUF2842 domain-containing protein [Aestuariivita sp.]MCY4288699.1 DUF2842 domain-containing protein [Aestuariivita sp.]MCY4345283.1 DUF2842 domain-containing protein [Aestuariivita sp.]